MSSVYIAKLPTGALLEKYAADASVYTDCFAVAIAQVVSFDQYVEAFYTTWLFRLERLILGLFGMRSTDEQARELALAQRTCFAAWQVEARAPNQLLLDAGRTRSWLMLEPSAVTPGMSQTLFFGSAVVSGRNGRMGLAFKLLLGAHKLYSRLLLKAASRRLAPR